MRLRSQFVKASPATIIYFGFIDAKAFRYAEFEIHEWRDVAAADRRRERLQ